MEPDKEMTKHVIGVVLVIVFMIGVVYFQVIGP
jgi:hypothetical protein